jgi:hypothetical protein
MDIKDLQEKEWHLVNEGQTSLAKWLIGLSTGVIVFSVKLIKPETSLFWKNELTLGLAVLIVSIILGVRYVRAVLDGAGYVLRRLCNLKSIDVYSKLNPDDEVDYEGKKIKVKDKIQELRVSDKDFRQKLNKTSKTELSCYLWQQRLFYVGIVLVTIFGIINF